MPMFAKTIARLAPLIALATATSALAAVPGHALEPRASSSGTVPAFGRVFVIVGENTSLKDLTAVHAPYIVNHLKPRSAWLVGDQAVAGSSSLGNYIAMTSGQSIACERNNSSPVNLDTDKPICHQSINNVFRQLDNAKLSWAEWNESMPHPCAFYDDGTGWAKDVYSAHHNPALYYDSVEGAQYSEDFALPPKKECITHDVPMGSTGPNNTAAFDKKLTTRTMPRYNLIVPNDCENGHDTCGTTDAIRQFDAFVKREIPKIEASPAFGSNGVIVVTWDEAGDATPNDRSVGSLWISPLATPGVYTGSWTHASLLRTVEAGLHLPLINGAATATPVDGIWK